MGALVPLQVWFVVAILVIQIMKINTFTGMSEKHRFENSFGPIQSASSREDTPFLNRNDTALASLSSFDYRGVNDSDFQSEAETMEQRDYPDREGCYYFTDGEGRSTQVDIELIEEAAGYFNCKVEDLEGNFLFNTELDYKPPMIGIRKNQRFVALAPLNSDPEDA